MKQTLGFLSIVFLLLIYSLLSMNLVDEVYKSRAFGQKVNDILQPHKIELSTNSYIVDANGQLVEEVIGEENRRYLPFQSIPKAFIDAFISTEDQYFFHHHGFDISGISRSLLVNLKDDRIEQGGSTITQQLIRNLYLTNEKTMTRKLKEILLSYQLEKQLSKEKILEYYLNAIYFQHGIYGIETASQFYFSRPATSLNLAEISFLCAIPNNPTYYDPIHHYEHTKKRQQWILQRMLNNSAINQEAYQAALKQPVKLNIQKPVRLYPDYTTYVYHEFSELIGQQEGFHKQLVHADPSEQAVIQAKWNKRVYEYLYQKGVIIHTALDPQIQAKAKESLLQFVPQKDIEGAITVLDHRNHQILAIIAGKNIQQRGFNRAFQSYRQPGSTIKPLLVYGPFLDQLHVSIKQMVSGAPFCKGTYCPQNYDRRKYGMIPLSSALKYSLNTAAVRLLDQIGVEIGFSYFEKFGFNKVTNQDQRLTAALGGLTYGVTPLEFTKAYTTFANQGNYIPSHAITRVTDLQGNILYQWKSNPLPVWSEETNEKMRVLLSTVVKEGTGTPANFPSPYIGGKTGTTDGVKDLWFIGLTDQYTAGVWLGYDQPRSLAAIEKQHPHLLIWKQIMLSLVK